MPTDLKAEKPTWGWTGLLMTDTQFLFAAGESDRAAAGRMA
jgi:hypothetical protein